MAKDAKGKLSEVKASKKPVEAAETLTETKPAEEKPAEAKAEEVKKEEPKKAEPKKEISAPVQKAAAAKAKKPVKEKEPVVPELFVQYTDDLAGEQEANISEIVTRVKAAYVAEGHRESSIKALKIYMKPQEWKAYYVINNKIEGNIELF